jgi:hypothetical protein
MKINEAEFYEKYWASTAEERRQKLMPFLWGTFLKKWGAILGNRERGTHTHTHTHLPFPLFSLSLSHPFPSHIQNTNTIPSEKNYCVVTFLHFLFDLIGSVCKITNRYRISYPGYHEILSGFADDEHIRSNDEPQTPHPTIFEFIKHKFQLNKTQVAAFCSWKKLAHVRCYSLIFIIDIEFIQF